MNLLCTNCGEPWSADYLGHDTYPEDFVRKGGLISRCPCCRENAKTPLSEEARRRIAAIVAAAPRFGEDLEGIAVFLEDMAAIGLK